MHHFSNYAINEIVYNFCANFLFSYTTLFYLQLLESPDKKCIFALKSPDEKCCRCTKSPD